MDEHEQHDQGHDHSGHNHSHDVSGVKSINLLVVMLLNFIITLVEFIGGIYAGSLSLISDALHNLSDALSIIVSYVAIKLSSKAKDENRTYGYKRATIIAAFINSAVLIAISLLLLKEAYVKFMQPEPVNGLLVIWVAVIGLLANALGAYLLHSGSQESMNLKSTYLHLLSDALSSVGVVIGGMLIYFYKIYWVDPLLTVLISIYVLKESYHIVSKAVHVLMQGTPSNLDVHDIVHEIEHIEGVENIHHVHLWSMDEKNINFEAHVNVQDILVKETQPIYERIEQKLRERFGINHLTIQFEFEGCQGVGVIK